MARVALVTGGTRGIGAAISKSLKAAGHTVVANYGGNDEKANAFKEETGIDVAKFDVGDAAACEALIARGAAPDAADEDGNTALHCAAGGGHLFQLGTTIRVVVPCYFPRRDENFPVSHVKCF